MYSSARDYLVDVRATDMTTCHGHAFQSTLLPRCISSYETSFLYVYCLQNWQAYLVDRLQNSFYFSFAIASYKNND